LFHYCAYHLETIANSVRDVDLAIRWGFGWQQGPFELWQQAGFEAIAQYIKNSSHTKHLLAKVQLPEWVTKQGTMGVYKENAAFSPQENSYCQRSSLTVYKRQLYPDSVLGETFDQGTTIYESDAIRFWTTGGDDIGIISFKSKKNTVSQAVLDGIQESLRIGERSCSAIVLWQNQGKDFSYGLDLSVVKDGSVKNNLNILTNLVNGFQETGLALKYSTVPTIAAVKGLALGGGLELIMHCTRTVACLESYVGLVESSVGLIPAGGGSKEMVFRAQSQALNNDLDKYIERYFKTLAMAEVASSALDAKDKGLFKPCTVIVNNPHELLYIAKSQARCLAESGYQPPISLPVRVAGKNGLANLMTMLVNLREGQNISDHDFLIASKLAYVLCGGAVESGSVVDEAWLLKLEREAIIALAQTDKTIERIQYTLANGKPLRN